MSTPPPDDATAENDTASVPDTAPSSDDTTPAPDPSEPAVGESAEREREWARERRLLRTQWAMVVATTLPGLAAVIALIFTYLSVQQSQEDLRVSEQGQITDRYNDAVTNLGDDSIDVRLGGIYALQRIMTDSERDRPTVVRILAAFVRVHAPITAETRKALRPGGPPPDLAAALTVLLDRESGSLERDGGQIDLHRTDLRGAYFLATHQDADLSLAQFNGADLSGAFFEGDFLTAADLRDANLAHAHLKAARLRGARLTGANLTGADLENAHFDNADITGADLTDANLELTDLRTCTGLTVQQVLSSKLGRTTRLPRRIYEDPRVRARMKALHERDESPTVRSATPGDR
ncbi:pentapeptide repeat-containing protein [Streptomyces sp. PRKS01-29]|nr:pentapeptide repeat-containing protein [Streptomyces sabulosicollis]MBI0297205.1 pentapeptide repeat-containing protein [Streptomyces sabulosicollis]